MQIHVEALQLLLAVMGFAALVFWQVVCPHGEDSTPSGEKARLNSVMGPPKPIKWRRPYVFAGEMEAGLAAEDSHRAC